MTDQFTCSLGECREPLLGKVVMLSSVDDDEIHWSEAGMAEYHATKKDFVILHPSCFMQLLNEFFVQEDLGAVLTMTVGNIGDVAAALMM